MVTTAVSLPNRKHLDLAAGCVGKWVLLVPTRGPSLREGKRGKKQGQLYVEPLLLLSTTLEASTPVVAGPPSNSVGEPVV